MLLRGSFASAMALLISATATSAFMNNGKLLSLVWRSIIVIISHPSIDFSVGAHFRI